MVRLTVPSVQALNEDPLLAGFAGVRDRDLRGVGDGLFVAEGEVVLRVLLRTGRYPIRSVLLSESMAERLLPELPAELPIYVAPIAVMQEIVGFPIHRGVLALASRGEALLAPDLLAPPGPRRVVGLCGLTNHDNVGGVFRNAAAFGCDAAILDGPTCDPLYRKAVRVSVGGSLIVPYAYLADEVQVVDTLLGQGYAVLALSPRGERVIGRDPAPSGRVALLAGAEGRGLSDETLARCQSARIPMRDGWDSLNVAVASGIALAWLAAA